MEQFGNLIKQSSQGNKQMIAKWASVQSVDFENGFCEVKVTGDDLPMYDVLLGFGNWKLKPKVETRCIVLEMEGRETAGVLIFAEEVETIEINGNQFVTLKVVLPKTHDKQLIDFVTKWVDENDYDVREVGLKTKSNGGSKKENAG